MADLSTGDYLIRPADGFIYVRTEALAALDDMREPTLNELKAWLKVDDEPVKETQPSKPRKSKTEKPEPGLFVADAAEPVGAEPVADSVPVENEAVTL